MPVLQKFVSLNQQTVMEMHSNKLESTRIARKVRIICSDPYATDPSDDEGIFSKNGKRFIREICLPFTSYRVSNASVTDGSAQDRNNGGQNPQRNKVLNLRGKKSSLSSRKYRGVSQRKWGKWSAEIRHPVNLKWIWLGTYKSAEDASIAYETKRIEFEALSNSKFAKNQDQNLTYDSASSSGLALDSSTLALGINGNDYEVTRKANVVEKEFTESERVDEELIALAQIGKELDLDLELDSIMLEGDDFTTPVDDFVNDFEDIPICGLFNEDQPGALPDFDFNFDFEDYGEAFSRMEEAPALMNGDSPLNIACP